MTEALLFFTTIVIAGFHFHVLKNEKKNNNNNNNQTRTENKLKNCSIYIVITKLVVSRCAFCKLRTIFGFFCSAIILADLLGNSCLLVQVQKVMVCDSWLVDLILFVCFVFQGSLLCDRPVSGNNGLVKFASQIFLIFLILVTWKIKATSAFFLRQKIYSPLRFPSLFLNSLKSFSAKLGEHVT